MKQVVHLCDGATSRMFKELYLLSKYGYIPTLWFKYTTHLDLLATVPSCAVWGNFEQLGARVKILNEDILHVHVSINSLELIKKVKKCASKSVSIVWDINDTTPEIYEELKDEQNIIIPSFGYKQFYPQAEVIYNKVPVDWVQSIRTDTRIKAVVLASEIGIKESSFKWRDYRDAEDVLRKEYELPLCIYPANAPNNIDVVLENYDIVLRRKGYLELLRCMAKYKYGYAGTPNREIDFDILATSKFWEYMSVATAPILWKSKEMLEIASEFYEYEISKLGIAIPSKTKMEAGRSSIYMDSEIGTLINLYNKINEGGKK